MKHVSFRTKLTLLNAVVVLVGLLGIGVGLIYTTQNAVLQSIDNDMRFRARQLTRDVPPAFGGPVPPGARGPGGAPMGFGGQQPPDFQMNQPPGDLPAIERPLFFGPEGKAVAPNVDVQPLDRRTLNVRFGPLLMTTVVYRGVKTRVLTLPIVFEGQFLGTMQFGRSMAEYDRLVETQTRLLMILIPLALIVATVAGSFLANRALKPVMEVTEAAALISANDLGRRLDVQGSDELAQLASTFNEMVERLQLSFEQQKSLFSELERALEKQRQFVADASHELRTPLARLKLTTSSALTQSGDEAELRESLRIADDAADTMGRLVQQLLVLARMDSRTEKSVRESVDLTSAAQAAVREFGQQGEARILTSFDDGILVRADQDDIVRCAVNLLENANRYTAQDGQIRVSTFRDGAFGVLAVEDNGTGIPAEHLPHVTERFYRVDTARSRKDGGCGLGLAICKSIVESYGGFLTVDSRVGEGTKVELRIPIFERE